MNGKKQQLVVKIESPVSNQKKVFF